MRGYRILFFTFFLIFCHGVVKSQASIDSINVLIAQTLDIGRQAELYLLKGNMELKSSSGNALLSYEKAIALYKEKGEKNGQYTALLKVGDLYSYEDDLKLSLAYDSLALQLALELGECERIGAYTALARDHSGLGNFDLAMQYFSQATQRAPVCKDNETLATLYCRKGALHRKRAELPLALESLKLAEQYAREADAQNILCVVYMNLGNTHVQMGKPDQGLDYHFKSLRIYESTGDEKGLIGTYINIGTVYQKLNDIDKSLEYQRKAYRLASLHGFKKNQALSLTNMAILHARNNPDSAIFLFKQAYTIQSALHDKSGMASGLNNIGCAWIDLGNYDSALHYLNRALSIRETLNAKNNEATTLANIGRTYRLKGQYDKAEKMLLKALRYFQEARSRQVVYAINEMSKLNVDRGDYKQALYYQEQAAEYKDSLFNENMDRKLVRIAADYELEKKQMALDLMNRNNEVLELKTSRQNLQIIGLLVFCLLAVLLLFAGIKLYRQKKRHVETLVDKNQRIEHLMMEMNHRTKNNFQVLSGIFGLQRSLNPSGTASPIDNKSRIDSIILLHQRLSENNSSMQVDAQHYFDELFHALCMQYGYDSEHIATNYELETPELDVALLTPLALIVNELVSNSLKYARPEENNDLKIDFRIQNRGEENLTLSIQDNGQIDAIPVEKEGSMGLKLVHIFAKQLNGTVSARIDRGLRWDINLKTNAG